MGLHIVEDNKNNLYKSFFLAGMVQYCQNMNIPIALIEGDSNHFELIESYPNLTKYLEFGNFNQDLQYLDYLFQRARTEVVIINLPIVSQSHFKYWIDKSDIKKLLQQQQINLYKWLVCTPDKLSLNHFYNSLEFYATVLQHILIKSPFIESSKSSIENWNRIEQSQEFQIKYRQNQDQISSFYQYEIFLNDLVHYVLKKVVQNEISLGCWKNHAQLTTLDQSHCFRFMKSIEEKIKKIGILEADWKACQSQREGY